MTVFIITQVSRLLQFQKPIKLHACFLKKYVMNAASKSIQGKALEWLSVQLKISNMYY